MRRLLLVFSGIAMPFLAGAQPVLPAFGIPDIKELLLTSCPIDSNANAMNIYNTEKIVIEKPQYSYAFKIKTEKTVRVKIFNEKGYKYASIKIPYQNKQKITDIECYIYNLDSNQKIVTRKITKKDIFKEKVSRNFKTVSFAFSGVQPGSVVEYRYLKIDKNAFQVDPFFLQDKIPTLYTSCRITHPALIKLKERFVKIDSMKTDMDFESGYLQSQFSKGFYMENVQAFSEEVFMSSVPDNLKRIEFALEPFFTIFDFSRGRNGDWGKFNYSLMSAPFWGGQLKKNIKGTDNILDSALLLKGKLARINYLTDAVKRHISWNHKQSFFPGDLEEAWKTGSGNSADINLLLLNLLRKSEVKCYPLLISTRDNGIPDQKFVSLSQFNGVDVFIDDSAELYVLDGTLRHHSNTIVPINVFDRDAFVIDNEDYDWIHLYAEKPLFRSIYTFEGTINKNGIIKGNGERRFYDYAKYLQLLDRKSLKDDDDDDDDNTRGFMNESIRLIKEDSLNRLNAEADSLPLIEAFQYELPLMQSGTFFSFNPFISPIFSKQIFTAKTRNTDIDFWGNHFYDIILNLGLEKGLKVEEMLPDTSFISFDSTLRLYRISRLRNDSLLVTYRVQIDRPYFTKEEYHLVQNFFDKFRIITNQEFMIRRED